MYSCRPGIAHDAAGFESSIRWQKSMQAGFYSYKRIKREREFQVWEEVESWHGAYTTHLLRCWPGMPAADGGVINFTRSSKHFPLLIGITSLLSRLSSSQLAFFQKPISARHCLRLPAAVSESGIKEIELGVISVLMVVQCVPLLRCPAAADEPERWVEMNPIGKSEDAQLPSKRFERAFDLTWRRGGMSGISFYRFLCSLVCKSHSEQVVLGTVLTQPA